MKHLFLVLILLHLLFFHVAMEATYYKEFAQKWYFDMDKKFDKNQKQFIIEQIVVINQIFIALQEMVLNKINESHYSLEDEAKISSEIINTLKKEKDKPLFQKLKSFYNVYTTYKMFSKTKQIIPCIFDIFRFVCEQQQKNKEELEKIIQNISIVFLLKAEASDETIKSLLSIIKPVQEIFAEIFRLDSLQQESSACIIL